ncbi:MAG: aldehyde ferredoxin oxidoreductase N-terminal domain-containing protein [Dehalococcoidales bacterium]|nr:aldehyde ferredoxin oxidoreductase N-terminal domain-containing protein [Dehalococcoidales bacterium]
MWYGWAGGQLEVDLTKGIIRKIDGDRKMYEAFLGGRGLITKMFWDRVPPETEPFSADNLLIFGAGPLVGTSVPGANRTTLVTRSPLTNLFAYSNMGGFWGPELKFAGYDTVTVSGKSSSPVYIYINDDQVEIRDASHLWGKDVFQTQLMIQAELKSEEVQTLCIGPAGENKVHYATIEHGPGCSLSRTGVGAVMGDKNLKAIAVRGTKDVNLASPTRFLELCSEILARSDKNVEYIMEVQHNRSHKTRMNGTHYRNFELFKPWEDAGKSHMDFLDKREARRIGCYNCAKKCICSPHFPDEHPVFIKCRSPFRFTAAADVQDYDFNLRCASLAQRYGLDVGSAPAAAAFAIDLYQKGILTKEDTDGMVLEWGNPEVLPALLEKIARREGIGDVLADGTYEAARRIGRGAEEYAVHIRKLEPRGQTMRPGMASSYLLSDRQDNSKWGGTVGIEGGGEGEGDKYAEAVNWTYPPDWKKYMDMPGEHNTLADCVGLCYFWSVARPDILIRDWDVAELLLLATGMNADADSIEKGVRRVRALTRAYNAILGERQRADDLPARFFHDPAGILPPVNRDEISKAIAETNKAMGYTAEGIPTREALEEIDLDYVAEELERRGVLPQPVSV